MGEKYFQNRATGPAALLLALTALVPACDSPPGMMEPPPGVLTVGISVSKPASLTNLNGRLELERLTLLSDVAPDARATKHGVEVRLNDPTTLTYEGLPQALYSGLRTEIEHLSVEASYKGKALHVELELEEMHVDLRGDGVDIALGHSANFNVAIDVGAWFSEADLDAAQVSGDSIVVDATHNADLVAKIRSRFPGAFSLTTQPLLQ